jgi:hypothetical protein
MLKRGVADIAPGKVQSQNIYSSLVLLISNKKGEKKNATEKHAGRNEE